MTELTKILQGLDRIENQLEDTKKEVKKEEDARKKSIAVTIGGFSMIIIAVLVAAVFYINDQKEEEKAACARTNESRSGIRNNNDAIRGLHSALSGMIDVVDQSSDTPSNDAFVSSARELLERSLTEIQAARIELRDCGKV